MLLALLSSAHSLQAGTIILTGQDSDFHASFSCAYCSNARSFLSTAIQDVRAGSTKPFLFVESSITPSAAVRNPDGSINGSYAFQTDGIVGIENSGYKLGVDFVKADASTLAQQLTQNLSQYSAIVVASDFGGILTSAELQILNDNQNAITDFLLSGGGLLALGESNDGIGPNATYDSSGTLNPNEGLLGTATPYGFLPFAVTSSNSYGVFESTASVTSLATSQGFTADDFTGNFYFNTFQTQANLQVLDADANGNIIAAEFVVSPEPSVLWSVAIGLLSVMLFGLRRALKNGTIVAE